MNEPTREQLRQIASTMRRAAQLVDGKPDDCRHERPCPIGAEHALLVTRGWRVPLSVADGPGPKGDHSDPTARAALAGRDVNAEHYDGLIAELGAAYKTAGDLIARLVGIEGVARHANRAGVGYCADCKRYADGKTARLMGGLCNRCRMRATRERAKLEA